MQITSLKGMGSAQKANVIKWAFQATVSAWDAMCDVIPDTPDRMNYTIMVQMRIR